MRLHSRLHSLLCVNVLIWLLEALYLLLRLLLQALELLLCLSQLLLQLLPELRILLLQLLLLNARLQALAFLQLPDQLLLGQPLLPRNLLLHMRDIGRPLLLVVVHPGK